MDYYKLRTVVLNKIKEHLEQRENLTKKGLNPPSFENFQRKLMLEHGVTENMVRRMIENLVPGATVKDGEISRVEE